MKKHDVSIENAAAELVTVPQACDLGINGLFAVQGGIPLDDALEAMSGLLNTAQGAICDVAMASDKENAGAVWAVEHLLQLARALNTSIHGGLVAGGRHD